MNVYSHLLVGLDLSEESLAIAEKAAKLAQANQAKISFAHIVEPLAFAYGGDVPLDLSEAQSVVEEQAKLRLDKLIETSGIELHQHFIAVGQCATELHRLAEENDMDLIVVGSHGRHGLALLFGSTANGVLHGAQCDVLAIRV
jgi:universal stress protein A